MQNMLNIAEVIEPPRFSWIVLLAMGALLAASLWMFWLLVRQWTSRRQWVSLAQWARESGFHLRPARREVLPQPLWELVRSDAQVRFHLCDAQNTLVQFQTDAAAPGAPRPTWNVLIRHRPGTGPVVGLRPAAAKLHLIDLLPLRDFAALMLGDRFIVHASEANSARQLADSSLPSLLPPDLGLILFENHVVLDFSSRPFDPIEFGRLIALADQLSRVIV